MRSTTQDFATLMLKSSTWQVSVAHSGRHAMRCLGAWDSSGRLCGLLRPGSWLQGLLPACMAQHPNMRMPQVVQLPVPAAQPALAELNALKPVQHAASCCKKLEAEARLQPPNGLPFVGCLAGFPDKQARVVATLVWPHCPC